MAQHDYVIDNSTGANVRADINSVFQAISSNNSGSSAPSTTYALQSFANTTDSMLQLRNAANNAFVNLRKFDGSCPLPDGSASSPSLFFNDDTNTGIFSGGADEINISTGGTERFFIDSSGNVSIGDTSNSSAIRLNVVENSTDAYVNPSDSILRLTNENTSSNTNQTSISFSTSTTGASSDSAIVSLSSASGSSNLLFLTDTSNGMTEKMRIETNGNVGIGTSSPPATLSIEQSVSNINLDLHATGSGRGSQVKFHNDHGTSFVGIAGSTDGALLIFQQSDAPTLFHTNNLERIRIDSSGNLFLGKTASDVNNTGVELMQSTTSVFTRNNGIVTTFNRGTNNGQLISLQRSGNEGGSIHVTTTSASFVSGSSDRSLKKNFEDWTENTLNLFKNLNPQKFNYIIEDDGAEKTKGYIAQELVNSFPEAYPKNDNDKYMFNPSGMVVYLMKAIQELEAKVEALEAA